tara:strand:+ start:10040 stop:10948 length:909 start_codon:yes stop_codon:yes gene_type:complete
MATEKIDTLQTAQIRTLEDNISELKNKLNLMVNDVLAITAKVNTVIGDMNNMNDVVMAGYTTPGSPESYGILESMDKYKDKLKDHEETDGSTWHWWPAITSLGGGNTGNYNTSDISGTLTGASWSSGSNAVTFTGTTGTITKGQRMQNSGSVVGHPIEGPANGAMIDNISGNTLWLTGGNFYLSGSGTLSFVAKKGTIHYGVYYDNYWTDSGPWNQDWFEHPRMNRAGTTSAKSGSAGASSYDNPALGGTGQAGNSPHTAGAQNSTASGNYETPTKRMLTVKRSEAKRAKKLARQTLNRLRK